MSSSARDNGRTTERDAEDSVPYETKMGLSPSGGSPMIFYVTSFPRLRSTRRRMRATEPSMP